MSNFIQRFVSKHFKMFEASLHNGQQNEIRDRLNRIDFQQIDDQAVRDLIVMYSLLLDKYDQLNTHGLKFPAGQIWMPRKNIDAVISELKSFTMIIARGDLVPVQTNGHWLIEPQGLFIDDNDRYIPYSKLQDYFEETIKLFQTLLEQYHQAQSNTRYNLNQLSRSIECHAQLGIILLEMDF